MSELTITAANFTLQPIAGLRDGPAILRWAYTRSFLDSDGVQVFAGTQSSGFGIETPCSIASGLISVDQDSLLWTTDDAQDPAPLSIWISAWLLTPRGQLIAQLMIAGKAQFVVPSSLAPTTTWSLFSNYNQAVTLAYLNPNYYTAAQIDRLVRQWMDQNPATDVALGTVLLTVPADDPDSPVVWGANDPLVRDAVKIQGVDVDDTAPTDGQLLSYNQANNEWEPTTAGFGTGNVISNEVSSVDGQVALASGTGGKTIKFSSVVDDGTSFDASGMRVIASEYDSDSANLADNGTVRLGKDDFIAWRNEANGGNIILEKDASDRVASSGGFAGSLTGNVTGNLSGIAVLATDVVNADRGDITTSSGTWSIDNDSVTYAKMQNVSAADRLLGRGNGGGAGDVQEIELGTNLSLTGTTLNASAGTGTVGNVGTLDANELIVGAGGTDVTALGSLGTTTTVLHGNAAGAPTFGAVDLAADVSGDLPLANLAQASGASKLLGRGDSGAGDYEEISLGSGLSMSGTTLSSTGGSSTFTSGGFEQMRLMGFNKNPGSGTTTTAIGVTAITPFADSATADDDADGAFIRWNTAATTNERAGTEWNNSNLVQTSWLPQIFIKMKTHTSISVCRIWMGLFSAEPTTSDPASHGLGIRFDTTVPDTNWKAWSNDGSGGGSITDTGVAVATSTDYMFAIKVVSTSSVEFYVSTDLGVSYTLVATHATNLPTSTQGMNYWFKIITLENVAKSIKASYTYIRQR